MGLLCILSCLCVAGWAPPALVINEVYYDHEGPDGGHEFVEIYNPAARPVSLAGISIQFHNGSGVGWEPVWSAEATDSVPAAGVFTVGGADVRPVPDVVVALSLQNGPEAVGLFADGDALDLVGYGGLDDPLYMETAGVPPVPAGWSIARIPDGRDTGVNRDDFEAARPTPTLTNVARHDVFARLGAATALRGVVEPGAGALPVYLVNGGTEPVGVSAASLSARDSTAAGTVTLGTWRNDSAIAAGDSLRVDVTCDFDAGYHWLTLACRYRADERAGNDTLTVLRRAGTPALLVSEVLSSPPGDCPQFVEVYNAGAVPVNIGGYGIRDRSHAPVPIAAAAKDVSPGAFAVIAPDADALRSCFHVPGSFVCGVNGRWPTVNRTGGETADSVVVVDPWGLPVDGVAVPAVPAAAAGRSLERVDLYPGARAVTWVLSRGGPTPGSLGERVLLAPPPVGILRVAPNPFVPGEELLTVSLDVPGATRLDATVFDPRGRRVADLGVALAFPAVLVWNGRDAAGSLVLPGLYVVACEVSTAGGRRVLTEVIGCARP